MTNQQSIFVLFSFSERFQFVFVFAERKGDHKNNNKQISLDVILCGVAFLFIDLYPGCNALLSSSYFGDLFVRLVGIRPFGRQ